MHLDDAADLCRRYTGESWAGAKARIRQLPEGTPPIPAAHGDQAFLESEVLRALLEYPTTWTTRPLRVNRVIPRATGLVLRFAADSDAEGLAETIAWGLFATGGEDDLRGISGLRVIKAGHGRVDVGLLGTSARVRLEGIPGRAWREAQHERQECADELGEPVPFEHRRLTPGERAFSRAHQWHEEAWRKAAPLGSALLRRLLIFRAGADWLDMAGFTKHACTYGFCLSFAKAHWTPHDMLLHDLTHPLCGIALKEDMRTCNCAFGQTGCRIWLDAPGGCSGRLDLQLLDVATACDVAEYNQALTFTGSPSQEILRVTGSPPGASVACAPRCHGRHDTVAHLRRTTEDRNLARVRRRQKVG